MLKYLAVASVISLTALTPSVMPIYAQTSIAQKDTLSPDLILFLNRAKNIARMAAERENGGLGNYRAERSMHGPATDAPYKVNGDGSVTFTFKGTRPGEDTPSYESVVTVSKDDTVKIDYNGPVRSSGQ